MILKTTLFYSISFTIFLLSLCFALFIDLLTIFFVLAAVFAIVILFVYKKLQVYRMLTNTVPVYV